jgi:ribosomal protein S6--L-glutamate ligase
MRRQAPPGEVRSNLHRGAIATKTKLTPEERSTAVRAARALGLNVSGVDIIRSKRGPLVMEVNSSPGLEGIEKATGLDVASGIIEFIERAAVQGSTQDTVKG